MANGNGLKWDFHFTPLRDADTFNSGSSRAWGDLGNNIAKFTKWAQKQASDPVDEALKREFASKSPEEQLALMQQGNFIPAEYMDKVSPEMRDKYRLTTPEQSMLWQNSLAKMNQQKQAAEIQRYGFDRTKLQDNRLDAVFNYDRDAFALKREWENAVASGNPELQQQVRNKLLDWQHQQINQNPNLIAPPIPTHRAGLAELNAHQEALNTWNTTRQNQRVDALIPELTQLLGGAAPGSDAANVIMERMQQSSTPEQWHDITLAYQKMMTSGLMAHSYPSLAAQANAAEDAENAVLMGGGVGNGVVGSAATSNPNQPTPSFSQMANGGVINLALKPLTVRPITATANSTNDAGKDSNSPYPADSPQAKTLMEMRTRESDVKALQEEIIARAKAKEDAKEVESWKKRDDQLQYMLQYPNKTTPFNTFPNNRSLTKADVLKKIDEHNKKKPQSLIEKETSEQEALALEQSQIEPNIPLPSYQDWANLENEYQRGQAIEGDETVKVLEKMGLPLSAEVENYKPYDTLHAARVVRNVNANTPSKNVQETPSNIHKQQKGETKENFMNRMNIAYAEAWSKGESTGDFSEAKAIEDTILGSKPRNTEIQPIPTGTTQATNKNVGLALDAYAKGARVTDKAEDMVYGNYPTSIPLSQMTIGQVTDELQPALIKETRANPKHKIYDKNGKKVGTSAAGLGQFLKGTLEDLAPKVFGPDWKNVQFSRENQEKLLRARYDQAFNSQQIPGVVWEGLEKRYGGKKGFEWVREKGGFRKAPSYEVVRELILETESKLDKATASQPKTQPKQSYSETLPDVLQGYFIAAEAMQNGERSDELTSFINAGRSNKSALDILNEYAKATVSLKYGKDDSQNTFPFEPNQFHTLVNATREELAKEGISVKPAQVAQIVINSAKLKQGKLWGRGDEIDMDEKALRNVVREMYKSSIDPERTLTERIHNEYISVAPLVERVNHLNNEIAKMESRQVKNAGTQRQIEKAKKMREELAKQVTQQIHQLQGNWGLAKMGNQG